MGRLNRIIKRIKKIGFKKTISIMAEYRIYQPIDKFGIKFFRYITGNKLKNIIVLESHNDFDSNSGAFYDYLIKNGYNKKYKIVWLLQNPIPKYLPYNVNGIQLNKLSLKKWYYLSISKYILFCHHMFEAIKQGQKAVYLTHGAISIKNVKGKIIVPEGVTCFLAPSKYLLPILADQHMMPYPNNIMRILGYPVHDILYNNSKGDLKKITKKKYLKTLLWMPTFRQAADRIRLDSDSKFPMGIPIIKNIIQYKELNTFLHNRNMLLIIKIHPMQDLRMIKVKSLSNIIILNEKIIKNLEVNNYRLMKDANAMISDYSSVANDFLHLNRPIAYTLDDFQNYNLGFIVDDPRKLMAGTYINTIDDLKSFIEDIYKGIDKHKEERKQLLDKMFDWQDGNSCKRLAKYLNL